MLKRNLTSIYLLFCIIITPLILNLFIHNWSISLFLTVTVVPSYIIAYIVIVVLLFVLRTGQIIKRQLVIILKKLKSFINSKLADHHFFFGFEKIKFRLKDII
jgi:hypothetical protein